MNQLGEKYCFHEIRLIKMFLNETYIHMENLNKTCIHMGDTRYVIYLEQL